MTQSLLVGTTKGAFVLEMTADRATVSVRGPFCDGWPINHVVGCPDTGRLWAGGGGDWHGAGVWRSDDNGATWTLSKLSNGKFDDWMRNDPDQAAAWGVPIPDVAPFAKTVDAVWSLAFVDGVLFAGVKPAALFRSTDGGATWTKVESLNNQPGAESWQPGAAGLTLHTIVSDPKVPAKMWLGISAAGVFATEDGGQTWEHRVRRTNAEGQGEIGHCVHNMVRAAGDGDILYQQNHHGVFRSADGARSWQSITDGLPSDFGFPVAVHPRDPQTLWVFPLNGDSQGRFPTGAKAAVWQSSDGGQTWVDRRAGLPQEACYFTVLRQAMTTDSAEPAGVYFGTNSGSVFASVDEGENWSEVARHLPTVLSVETLTVA